MSGLYELGMSYSFRKQDMKKDLTEEKIPDIYKVAISFINRKSKKTNGSKFTPKKKKRKKR
jgi:hypothetical protein